MSDFENMQMPDLSTLSEGERRLFVRKMLTDENVRSKCILMAGNEGGGQAIDLNGLIQTVGHQKVEDLLVDVLGKAHTESAVMNDKDVMTLMEKVKNGTASPVEQQMAQFIINTVKSEMPQPEQSESTSLVAHTLLDILKFMKDENGYDMEYIDVLTAVTTLMIASTSINEKNGMYRFKDAGPDRVLPMLTTMADDIGRRLEQSFGGKKPPDDLLLLGLITYAEKIAGNMDSDRKHWADPKTIADFFGLTHDFSGPNESEDSSKETNGSNTCQPECFNENNKND